MEFEEIVSNFPVEPTLEDANGSQSELLYSQSLENLELMLKTREKMIQLAELHQTADWYLSNDEEGVQMYTCQIPDFNTLSLKE